MEKDVPETHRRSLLDRIAERIVDSKRPGLFAAMGLAVDPPQGSETMNAFLAPVAPLTTATEVRELE